MEMTKIQILKIEEQIVDVEKEISSLNSEINSLKSYVGGDMTGIEYVLPSHIDDASRLKCVKEKERYALYIELCALKIKKDFASFYGTQSASEFFDEKQLQETAAELQNLFLEIGNLDPERLSRALDGNSDREILVSKFEPLIRIQGINEDNEPYVYNINMKRNGLEFTSEANERKK